MVAIAIVIVTATSLRAQEIPGAAKIATGQPATLSYEDAVKLAIDNNLATLRAHERRNEARGQQQQALAPLLPNVSGVAYQASLTENLVALGFQPGHDPRFQFNFSRSIQKLRCALVVEAVSI
jgi:outer membrane protein TolC